MSSLAPETRTLFQRLLFRDTLNELFRCGDCGATLVCNIGLGRVRDGELIDVPCPHCKELWTFTRTLPTLGPGQELPPTDLDVLEHNWPSHGPHP